MSLKKCPECGGNVRPTKKTGRTYRVGTLDLPIPRSIAIPTCDTCGEQWIDPPTAKALDAALEPIYRRELQRLVKSAIERLTAHASPSQIEALLGLSGSYLARLRSGSKVPSADLVAVLSLLAVDPVRRLRELREMWQRGRDAVA